MRIFYAAPEAATSAAGSRIWRRNLYDSLVGMGHEVIEFRWDLDHAFENIDAKIEANRGFIEENRPLLSNELLRQTKISHTHRRVDLFFAYLTDALVLPAVIDTIRSMGIVTLNWYCNASYQFDLVREIAPHFDWCLVPERNRLFYYEAVGARPIYCPEAANPDFYRSLSVTRDIPVSFVGQAYGERPELARRVAEANISLKVFGPRWQDYLRIRKYFGLVERRYGHLQLPRRIYGGVVPDGQMVEIFNRTQINLGFSAVWKEGHREL
jgi:hypothetical protein